MSSSKPIKKHSNYIKTSLNNVWVKIPWSAAEMLICTLRWIIEVIIIYRLDFSKQFKDAALSQAGEPFMPTFSRTMETWFYKRCNGNALKCDK